MNTRATVRAYHFLPANFAVEDIKHHHLKISLWSDLNDPFELASFDGKDSNTREAFERSKAAWAADHGLLCFSRSWHNPLLWSHYADKHRGVVLGFDISEGITKPITYVSSRPRFGGIPTIHTIDEWMYTKFQDWRYEDEVRAGVLLDHSTNVAGFYFLEFGPSLVLREVVLGARCEIQEVEIQKKLAEYRPLPQVIRAQLATDRFEVVAQASPRS